MAVLVASVRDQWPLNERPPENTVKVQFLVKYPTIDWLPYRVAHWIVQIKNIFWAILLRQNHLTKVKLYLSPNIQLGARYYSPIHNISCNLVGNKLADHSDVVRACQRCSNCIFIFKLTPGLIRLRQLKNEARNSEVLGFGAHYNRCFIVVFSQKMCCPVLGLHSYVWQFW